MPPSPSPPASSPGGNEREEEEHKGESIPLLPSEREPPTASPRGQDASSPPQPKQSPPRPGSSAKAASQPQQQPPTPPSQQQQPPQSSSSSPSAAPAPAPAAGPRFSLGTNDTVKLVVLVLLVTNFITVPDFFRNKSAFLPIETTLRPQDIVVSSHAAKNVSASIPPPAAQPEKRVIVEAEKEAEAAATESDMEEDEEEDKAQQQQKEKQEKRKEAATQPSSSAGAKESSSPLWLSESACHFPFHELDPDCPRFIHTQHRWNGWAGLGDRFFQYLVGLTYAIEVGAFIINQDTIMSEEGVHGQYPWVPDFFKLNLLNANMTLAEVQQKYGNMTVIEKVSNHGAVYKERIAKLREQCHVIINVDNTDCIGGHECYFSREPRVYEIVRHIVSCWFLQTDRSALPPLIYDQGWYNVVVHLRVGDITLYDGAKGGVAFFTKLKEELDLILARTFPVHFYFFAESPSTRTAQADYDKARAKSEHPKDANAVFGEPPPAYAFLKEIFAQPPSEHVADALPQRVSFVNDLDVKATMYHQMNCDMIITTGSSFPLVAVTASPKPLVLYGKPKEEDFFETNIRHDYALVDADGTIFHPTLSEVAARAVIRFAEVHDKTVPYNVRIGGQDES